MNPEAIIAGASAALSVAASVYSAQARNKTAALQQRLDAQTKREDAAALAERVLHLYRQPLLDAANALQNRSSTSSTGATSGRTTRAGRRTTRSVANARDYTVYVIRGVPVLGGDSAPGGPLRRPADGRHAQGTHGPSSPRPRRRSRTMARRAASSGCFGGRQRAIAELMMVPTGTAEGPATECMGYAEFWSPAGGAGLRWLVRPTPADVETAAASSARDMARIARTAWAADQAPESARSELRARARRDSTGLSEAYSLPSVSRS
jgi:hypothetical protein